MVFKISFYLSSAICVIGILYRIWPWFTRSVGSKAERLSVLSRLGNTVLALLASIFSLNLFRLILTFIIDVILQFRTLRKDALRWAMHFLIFAGFMALLLMHALEDFITQPLFSDYEATLNPYLFLRNLFGFMVIVGLIIAALRRYAIKPLNQITYFGDRFALVLLAVIMVSGFLLEAAKIVSPAAFNRMVEEYTFGLDDPEAVAPLKLYWAKEFGVAFSNEALPSNEEMLEEGLEMHEESCAFCHSKPAWAFVSYPVSKAIHPFAVFLTRIQLERVLWYLHFLSCFIGLALLPFSKFFHIISTPVSLLVNGVAREKSIKPANRLTRRSLDLDGCTHCGICSLHCSVAPIYWLMDNKNILPSEKLVSLQKIASGKPVSEAFLNAFAEGSYICTACYRCTLLCPAGLNLQDLWLSSRSQLAESGRPRLERRLAEKDAGIKIKPTAPLPAVHIKPGKNKIFNQLIGTTINADTLSGCFKCKTCTNVCPVVGCCEDPAGELGMVPHQIMHAISLGAGELALDAKMIWACTTCYLCQEHCPQGVEITNILYGLKNLAYTRASAEQHQNRKKD